MVKTSDVIAEFLKHKNIISLKDILTIEDP